MCFNKKDAGLIIVGMGQFMDMMIGFKGFTYD
jgi:hypothetical protein